MDKINETVVLLTPLEDFAGHRLAKHIYAYLRLTTSFDLYFFEPLQKIFSKVIVYDFVKRTMEIGVKAVNEEIIALVRKERPKYVLWLPAYNEFRETTFQSIRKEGSILVGWFGDDEWHFDEYSKYWVPYLDYCVTNTVEAVPKYKAVNAHVIVAVPCTGIAIDRDWSNVKEKYAISFVGTRNAKREQYINKLKNKNIPICLFGRGWGGYVTFEEMIEIFSTSKINLNFLGVGFNKLQVNGRVFEICLAGGFLLTENAPGIENYFEIDKEIVCFKNAEEMVDKITYYLNHDEERRAVAQAGWEKAIHEYTSYHFVSKVFSQIEEDLTARGRPALSSRRTGMQMQMRKAFSEYYMDWGIAFSVENHKGLWKDSLALSISYYPFNIRAWYHYLIGFLPYSVRLLLIGLYRKLYRKLNSVMRVKDIFYE